MTRAAYQAAVEAHDPVVLEAGEYRWMGHDYEYVWFPRQDTDRSDGPSPVVDCTADSDEEVEARYIDENGREGETATH